MNTSILDKAKEIIKIRREKAEKIASDNKEKALAFPQFKSLYSKYMTVIIDNAKNGLASSVESKKLEKDFYLFKEKYKNIKDSDFVENANTLEMIKKINLYERKLFELGQDPKKIK